MESYINLGCIIRKRNLLAHVSIWTIAAIVLTISLTVFKGNLFGIIYLTFFLTFVLTFQGSYSLWARSIKLYCIALILYSVVICVLTYTFQYNGINSLYKEILSEQVLNDIGLVVRSKGWMLFLEPFVPLTLTVLLIVYLEIFQDDFNRFVYLAQEDDSALSTPLTAADSQAVAHQTINDSTTIIMLTPNITTLGATAADQPESMATATAQEQQHDHQRASRLSESASNLGAAAMNTSIYTSRTNLRRASKRLRIEGFISAASECCWRILETHYIKLVAFMIFRLPVVDVCLMNLPFLIIVIFALKYPRTAKCSCLFASWLIAFIVIIRNLSNLTTLRSLDIASTCGPGAPQPLVDSTYSYLNYLGLNHDTGSPLNRVDNHILVLLLITVFSFISMHYERRAVKDYELSFGVIFTGIGRREADAGILNSLKYFCNFGFYKFGTEITCLALIIAISNRLDAIAAIYGVILILISIIMSKRTLASIWPVLNCLVSLLIPIQYLLRLGLPRALCQAYPWETMEPDFKYWLYLPNYETNQDTTLLLYDFLALLAICRQAVVFRHMRFNSNPPFGAGGGQLHHNFSANQFRIRYLPNVDEFAAEDCFSNYTTQSNYVKSIFFISIYWITLAAVLVAGATKISLFSLGYLIGCFIFLLLGNDTYLMPSARLIFNWNLFVLYATLVIFAKTVLQLFTCYFFTYLLSHCYILQLLRVVCYRKISKMSSTDPGSVCAASLPYDDLDILWDGLCLMFLLMQRVVFGSQYFRYLVQEVKAQQILASRGAELIMATQIEEAKAQALYEKEVMRSVREKMENLKSNDNEETSKAWKLLLTLPHHHQIIRNAGKHLFSASYDGPVSQCRTGDWKFKKAFIPDPIGDELERMNQINGISAVFTRWMKNQPLYGTVSPPPTTNRSPASPSRDETANDESNGSDGSNGGSDGHGVDEMRAIEMRPISQAGDGGGGGDGDVDDEILQSLDENPEDEAAEVGRVRGWWDMLNLIVYSCLLSATVELNKLSRSYRYVSRRMAAEKNILKRQFNLNDERFKRDPNWRKWVISTLSDTYAKTSQDDQHRHGHQSNTSLHRIRSALRIITSTAGSSQDGGTAGSQSVDSGGGGSDIRSAQGLSPSGQKGRAELTDPEYYFLKLNMFTQFCRALAYVFISNTSLLCQLIIICNQVLTASLLSLPLPLLTFLWGTLSVPRPTKRFWKTVITYTELVIVIKYVCQFPIWDWDLNNINPFYYPNLFGIKNITILYDLFLLLALFFHRSMLKSLGQWDASPHQGLLMEKGTAVATATGRGDGADSGGMSRSSSAGKSIATAKSRNVTAATAAEVGRHQQEDNLAFRQDSGSADEMRLVKSYQLEEGLDRSIELAPRMVAGSVELERTQAYNDYLHDSYQNQGVQEVKIEGLSEPHDGDNGTMEAAKRKSCCDCLVRGYLRTRRSVGLFFQHVLDTPYKVQTDVYTWQFLCDFINFLILIYGFWAFGGGYTNQTVASFLDENRIPFSVLIMLLAQFASIIIDRAFYLQKNIAGKLMFQVVLVIGIHFWLFFALPFTTGHTLTLKEYWPPKAWYIFKCIYFLLSAHQIRSGYPRRVLGNCFTKSFGYANWGAFKVYRAIPLVYDLRLYMDWIWTETTLEFRNWSVMEDMFANLFIRKCELTLEEEYPLPRARPIRRISKYLTGGAFILLILAIIWGPLLLFSMGKTVGESNPPVEMEYELEFVGYQPILRMRATAQQITLINTTQYNQLKAKFISLSSQSFLGDYRVGDVAAIRLDGQSNAVWEISPPSKEMLMARIKNNETLTLKSSWTLFRIKREKSQNFDVNIAGSYQYIINHNSSQEFRTTLYDMLANSSTTRTAAADTKFVITPPIFPNYLRVPETGQVSLVDQFKDNLFEYEPLRPLNLSYIRVFDNNFNQTDNSTSWWKADDLCKYSQNDSYPFWSPDLLPHCDSLVVVSFNDSIFTGLLAVLSAPGIIGLYTTFVVFFARLIRTEPSGKVIYTEIPKVDRIYGLIMDIYMMRECGEFELEEKLFAKLLFLYRSPEMIIEWSRRDDELQLGINGDER